MTAKDKAALVDALDAASQAAQYAEATTEGGFMVSRQIQDSICFRIIVAGEAVRRLSPEYIAAHPEVPWRTIADTRNRIVHGYDTIDLGIAWNIATVTMPLLAPILRRLIHEVNNETQPL